MENIKTASWETSSSFWPDSRRQELSCAGQIWSYVVSNESKRKVERDDKTWRRSSKDDMKIANIKWNTAEKMAPNRVRWRSFVDALCSTRLSLKDKFRQVTCVEWLLRAVFSALKLFLVFGNVVKHYLSCLAYYLNLHWGTSLTTENSCLDIIVGGNFTFYLNCKGHMFSCTNTAYCPHAEYTSHSAWIRHISDFYQCTGYLKKWDIKK